MTETRRAPDLLIAGAGVAGLYAAVCASQRGARAMLVTKGSLRASNSFFAQGGVAAAIGPDDSPQQHLGDTVRVGRGLCDPEAVRTLVEDGPSRIAHLASLGVGFDTGLGGTYALGREGGHSRRRILHAGGAATGAAIAETLIEQVTADENIEVVEHTAVIGMATDGTTCDGAWLLGHDELHRVRTPMTMLATGGAGALYLRSTNPPGALGDGIALAHRAGAAIRDMEFVQFHPTALAVGERAFLVSEAVRGEGALLVGEHGERFVDELAGRDVVARAIQQRLDAGHTSYLDLRHLDAGTIRTRFPNLVKGVAGAGLDLTDDLIPVAPAAHYLMGGIETGLEGQSTVDGLYACGESASSGVHGANRLASNSLLECFVFAHRAVDHGLGRAGATVDAAAPERTRQRAPLAELRRRMWEGAGPTRDAGGLTELCDWLADHPGGNPVLVAEMIAASALRREESRGAHVRTDHPDENPDLARSLRCPPLHARAM
ncbi:MAG: L-aspartate oxidase [Gaiellales bacterium]